MKKILIIINIITIIIIVVLCIRLSWCINGIDNGEQEPDTETTCNAGSENVSFEFSTDKACKLVCNYRQNHWNDINQHTIQGRFQMGTNIHDARSAWFSLSTLKGFIKKIEEKTAGSCCDTLGIRIYYGEYPHNMSTTELGYWEIPDDHQGLHTLLMVPTLRQATPTGNINRDINLYNGLNAHKCFESIFDCSSPDTILALVPMTARNHGELIPPPFPNVEDGGAHFMKAVDANPNCNAD